MAGRAGFTLIELLAVLLIVGILASILVTQLGGAEESARIQTTRQSLSELRAVIDQYANEFGDAPASSFTEEQGVANEGTNVGAEALVVALWSRGWEAGGLTDLEDGLVNTDLDASSKALTDFATRDLLEIPDAWSNPIAYIHRRDYDARPREYVTLDPVTGEEIRSAAAALENPTTGRWYRHGSYQLVSAGPDGRFGTEDDVTDFDRE